MTQPASVFTDGMTRVDWVPDGGIASPAAPTAAELTAGTVKALSGYFTDSGWNPNTSETEATDGRLNSVEDYGAPGRRKAANTISYVTNPDSPADDVAALTLTDRVKGYFVERRGVDEGTAFAAGDIVNVFPVTLGVQNEPAPTANGPFIITQVVYNRTPGVQRRVTVA